MHVCFFIIFLVIYIILCIKFIKFKNSKKLNKFLQTTNVVDEVKAKDTRFYATFFTYFRAVYSASK